MQPEPSLPQERQPETPVTQEQPPAPPVAQESQPIPSVPQMETKKSRWNVFKILFFTLLTIFVLTAAGLGYWIYQLDAGWKTTQAELADLRNEHNDLTAVKNGLEADLAQTTTSLEQTQAELEQTKEELATTQSDLTKPKNETAALRTRMDKAWKYAEIARGVFADLDKLYETAVKVSATGDATLESKFEIFVDSQNDEDFLD